MRINQKKVNSQQISSHQNFLLQPQITQKVRVVAQITKKILIYKEKLRKIIKRVNLMSQTHEHQWKKIYDELFLQSRRFESQSTLLLIRMQSMNFFDLETRMKMEQLALDLSMKFSQFGSYILTVKRAISLIEQLPFFDGLLLLKRNRICQLEKDLDLQAKQRQKTKNAFQVEEKATEKEICRKFSKTDLQINENC